mgnify:CR=1 FL=1
MADDMATHALLVAAMHLAVCLPYPNMMYLTPAPHRLVEPRLSHVRQRTMIIAGGQDLVLPADKESKRLVEKMQRAFAKVGGS